MSGNSEDKQAIVNGGGETQDRPGAVTAGETAIGADPAFSPLYPQDPINGFLNGCLLDLRVRLAVDFLKTSPVFRGTELGAADLAACALELADELLKQGAARGWVTAVPEDGELTAGLRAQAKRNAIYGVLQQIEGNRAAMAEQSSIAVPVVPTPGRKMN